MPVIFIIFLPNRPTLKNRGKKSINLTIKFRSPNLHEILLAFADLKCAVSHLDLDWQVTKAPSIRTRFIESKDNLT